MSSTTPMPLTSHKLHVLPEVRAAVERRIIEHQTEGKETAAPEGFSLDLEGNSIKEFLTDLEFCGCWVGPTAEGPGWKIASYWSPVHGVYFYVDSEKDNGVPAGEAGNVAAALGRFAELAESTAEPARTPPQRLDWIARDSND